LKVSLKIPHEVLNARNHHFEHCDLSFRLEVLFQDQFSSLQDYMQIELLSASSYKKNYITASQDRIEWDLNPVSIIMLLDPDYKHLERAVIILRHIAMLFGV